MKIKGVRVSKRKIGPVKPRQSGRRPVLATEPRAREVKQRRTARGKPERLRKEQGFRPRSHPEQGSQHPKQRRLVVVEEVDSPFHRRNVAIPMRQIPDRVGENAQVEPMRLESAVTQERNPKEERSHPTRSTPECAARRARKRIEPCLRKLRSLAEKEALFPGLARPAPHCHCHKQDSQIGQRKGMEAWYLEPSRIRQQGKKDERPEQNVEQAHV